MMGWTKKKLADVVDLKRGFDLPYGSRVSGPVPVVSAGGGSGWHNTAMVDGPGFAIGRATNLGQPTWSDVDYWPLNTTLYVADFHGNEPRWTYHLFQVLDLTGFDSGSVQPMLNRNNIASLLVEVPPRAEQVAIAAVLGALDDKIAANTAVAETADALSEARFAALEKPVVAPLTEVARFINGKAFTKDASGSGRVVIRIAELNSGIGNSTVYSDIEVEDDYTANPGDLLFAWSGSLTVNRWYRPEAIINQHIFKVIPRDGYPMWLANQALRSRLSEFKSIASDKATTMGHIQRRHLEEPVALPSHDMIAREAELMDGLWRVALGAEMENLTLTALRDTLLPALMSGRLRVRDAERQVEDSV